MKNYSLPPLTKYYFFLLIFSPIISFLIKETLKIEPIYFYRIFTFLVFIEIILLKKSKIKFPKYLYFLIFYMIFLFVWDIYNFTNGREEVFEIIRKPYFETIAFILIIENTVFSKKYISKIIYYIKVTIVFAAIFTLIQYLYKPHFFLPSDSFFLTLNVNSIYTIRRTSVFGYVNANAIGLSFLPIVALYYSSAINNKSKNILFFIFLTAFVVLGSNSRYIMGAFLIILFIYPFQKKINAFNILKIVIGSFIIVLISIIILEKLGYNLYDFYTNRLFQEQSLDKSSRYLAYKAFISFFGENWLFGTGVHLTTEIIRYLQGASSQIHVGYFSHLVSYGIVGSFFMFSFWYSIARNFYKTAKKTNFYGSFFAFLVFLWANATLVYYPIFTYGFIIVFMFNKYYRDSVKIKIGN